MKRLIFFFILSIVFLFIHTPLAGAQTPTPPIICGCPDILQNSIYSSTTRADGGGQCVYDLQTFQQDPARNHLWVEDPEITSQGKADERARQFLFWVFSTGTVESHPALINVWDLAKNTTLFLLLIVAAVLGVGLIIGQRAQFTTGIKVVPLIVRLALLIIYVVFSATVIILLIQLSDVLMKFFIEKVGGKDLFNINFGVLSGEENYVRFVGCRDLNIRVQEGVQAELVMLRVTNLTYYVMGVMLLLRKILLWFLLFVSPFLALLLPFVFIRNTGWIWIGVFFQWLLYGPLFALFLGGVATMWQLGIPFIFDFSRIEANPGSCNTEGYIYPTAINILYGGPAQKLAPCNNGNYIDTFAEYIISLIMLWAVTFFPWWLLRIFRDYCCEGIYASKNILMSMYDQMRGGPPPSAPGPVPVPIPGGLVTGVALKIPKEEVTPTVSRLETVEDIKKTRTEDITRSLQISATHLTDIARFETNKKQQETVTRNLSFLQNPMKAETPTERQKYMNIRSELFNRAVKEDRVAKQILSSISTSKIEQLQRREEMVKTTPQAVAVSHIVSVKVKIPTEKVQSTTSSFVQSVSQNTNMVQTISQLTQIPQTQVQSVLNAYTQSITQPTTKIIENIASQTGLSKEKVSSIIQNTSNVIKQSQLVDKVAVKERVAVEHVEKILSSIPQILTKEKEVVTNVISTQLGIPIERATSVTRAIFTNTSTDNTFISQIARETNLQTDQVRTILNTFTQNVNQPVSTTVNNIAQQTGVDKEKVVHTITSVVNNLKSSKETVRQIAQKENIKESDLHRIVESQIPVVAQPEKHIEQTISIPPSVSLDEYEQVKKMWKDQYERGEVPISDKIKSRDQWIDQDVVFVTNTLNKLVSTEPEIRHAGLDDLAYILPIFLINNLKADELLVYLKAKLEAAKETQTLKAKEKEIEEKVKEEKVEEFVTVEKPKVEEKEKEMKLEEELEQKEGEEKQAADKKEAEEKAGGEIEDKQTAEEKAPAGEAEQPKSDDKNQT